MLIATESVFNFNYYSGHNSVGLCRFNGYDGVCRPDGDTLGFRQSPDNGNVLTESSAIDVENFHSPEFNSVLPSARLTPIKSTDGFQVF